MKKIFSKEDYDYLRMYIVSNGIITNIGKNTLSESDIDKLSLDVDDIETYDKMIKGVNKAPEKIEFRCIAIDLNDIIYSICFNDQLNSVCICASDYYEEKGDFKNFENVKDIFYENILDMLLKLSKCDDNKLTDKIEYYNNIVIPNTKICELNT
jgi:hypothetical protein